MDGLTIRRADGVPLDILAATFNRAFEGYFVPMWQTTETLATMINNNDVLLDASLLLEDEHGAFVGIALLGVREARGWVGGMGIAREWRGKRAGHELMSRLIDEARARHLRTVQLEVLDQNVPASRLYSSLGFEKVRPLIVYTGPITPPAQAASTASGNTAPTIIAVQPDEALTDFDAMHPTQPPWQRERDALLRMAPQFEGVGIRDGNHTRSYLLSMPLANGISVLDCGSRAPTADARTADAITLLLHLHRQQPQTLVRAINIPPGDPLDAALAQLQCPVVATQSEMLLTL